MVPLLSCQYNATLIFKGAQVGTIMLDTPHMLPGDEREASFAGKNQNVCLLDSSRDF